MAKGLNLGIKKCEMSEIVLHEQWLKLLFYLYTSASGVAYIA